MTDVPEVDVEQIMKQIREDIARKRSAGASVMPSRNSATAANGHASAELAALHTYGDIYNVRFTSHRSAVGPFIVFLKRVLRKLLNPILTRQVAYNAANTRVTEHFREQMEALRREQAQLREEALATQGQARQGLEKQMEALRREQAQLREEVLATQGRARQRVEEQVEALIREQAQLREQGLATQAQALKVAREQIESLRIMRERISRAERKLRRILHSLVGEDHQEGEKLEAKGRARLREDLEPDFDYFGFEERFRGSEEEIKERQRLYVEYFKRAGNVLDIGCGRGEFLELLKEAGVEAKGVDFDLDMVLLSREKGLDVVKADAFSYLGSLPDESLQGIFSSQVIEHLDSSQIVHLVKLAHRKLRPNGVLILETPNPRCLTVFAESFYMDLSHIRLVHPETARFLLESTGFHNVELKFSAPVEHSMRIPPLPPSALPEEALDEFNRGVERLNDLLYGFQDYAVIGEKVAVLT
jgi:SAM-dependent methyltransferase